jgi:DNA-binding PadR family transcriptional regulator
MCIVSVMTVGHVLLGVLAEGPGHGYDLKRSHDARFPGAKPLAYSQIYTALAKLERDGQVEAIETVSAGGPERTTYALSDSGREALTSWLAEPEPAGPYAADELVRKTVTALRLGADAAGYLRRQREAHLGEMRRLLRLQDTVDDVASRIVLDHAISHVDADLKWLETAATRVADHQKEAKR